jgi:hypothetical protein
MKWAHDAEVVSVSPCFSLGNTKRILVYPKRCANLISSGSRRAQQEFYKASQQYLIIQKTVK